MRNLLLIALVLASGGCGLAGLNLRPARSATGHYEARTLPDVQTERQVQISIEMPEPTGVEAGEVGPGLVIEPSGRVTAPPQARVRVAIREEEQRRGGQESRRETATASSAGVTSTGNAPKELSTAPPRTKLPSGAEAGGEVSGFSFWERVQAASMQPLYWMGGAAVLAGAVVLLVLKQAWLGAGLGAAGGALIAVGIVGDRYPWVALLVPLVCMGALVWFLLASKKGRDIWTTLKAVVGAVEVAEGGPSVKEAVARAAGSAAATVKAVVTAAKNEEGL